MSFENALNTYDWKRSTPEDRAGQGGSRPPRDAALRSGYHSILLHVLHVLSDDRYRMNARCGGQTAAAHRRWPTIS